MQALTRYWATVYDWRKIEAKMNALPQFLTEIDGLDIHFIHVRSKHENELPLIVTITEQMKIIDPLTDPTAHAPRSWAERAYPKLIHFNKLPRAVTLRPGNSRSSFQKRFARASDRCGRVLRKRKECGAPPNQSATVSRRTPVFVTGLYLAARSPWLQASP
jgi:hypothetical protein